MVTEASTAERLGDEAIDYARQNWQVVPLHSIRNGVCTCSRRGECPHPGKHPRWHEGDLPNGLNNATADVRQIGTWWERWPDANIGIRMGSVSGLLVIEWDFHGETNGIASFKEFVGRHGKLPKTRMVTSGGGGKHLYYRHPGAHVRIGSGEKLDGLPGLDIKADGGYIVAPPSHHQSGNPYCWDDPDAPIAELPAGLIAFLASKQCRSETTPRIELPGDESDGEYWLARAVDRASPGDRNNNGFWLACQLRDAVLDEVAAEPLMERYAELVDEADAPYKVEEALNSLRSAYSQEPREPARSERSRAAWDDAQELVATVQTASAVFEAVAVLAALPARDYATVKLDLKAALGSALNLNDLDRAVNEARRGALVVVAAGGLPDILSNNRPLRDVTEDAVAALQAGNSPESIFVRSGSLTRVRTDENGRPLIERLHEAQVRGHLARVANFMKTTEKGRVHVAPPDVVVQDVMAMGAWPFPALEAVVEVPVLRPDGTVMSQPGYDARTRLVYVPAPQLVVPDIPERPTAEDVAKARALVEEAIGEFPYQDAASRANAMALLLTPVVRPAINGNVPLALLDAPRPGTGKSLLAEVISIIATGRNAAMMTAPYEEDEWRKKITATLGEGATMITIDNVKYPLASAHLDAALTSMTWQDRVLGTSDNLTVPQRATWMATGNNLRVGGDLPRRCYWIRLDAKMANPWKRANFKHPELKQWVMEHRGELLAALLTLARAWYAAGQPKADVPRLGSFETWAEMVGGILAYAGVEGFLGNLDTLHEQVDEESQQWAAFLAAIAADSKTRDTFTTADLAEAIKYHESVTEAVPDDIAQFRHVDDSNFKKKLGKVLASRVDARFDDSGRHLVRAGKDSKGGRPIWRVVAG
jgi:hypothetical protein